VVFAGPGAVHFCIVKCSRETPDKRYRCMYFKSWCEGAPGEEIGGDEAHRRLDAQNAAEKGELHLMFPAIYHQGGDTTYGQLAYSADGQRFVTPEPLGPGGDPYPAMFGKPDGALLDKLVSDTVGYWRQRENEVKSLA